MPAKSIVQQRLFGMALSYKLGKLDKSKVTDKIIELSKLSSDDLKKFAATPHKDLPYKIKETLQLASVPGMGQVSLPGDAGNLNDFSDQSVGSGDIPHDLTKKKKKRKLKHLLTINEFLDNSNLK